VIGEAVLKTAFPVEHQLLFFNFSLLSVCKDETRPEIRYNGTVWTRIKEEVALYEENFSCR
jgi:hypothetical protein